LSTKGMITRGY